MTYTKADEVIVRAIELQQAADEIIEDGHMHTHHLARLRSASERLDDAIAAEALKPPEPDAALARIEALERERDAALRSRDDWIRENGPGGWIDALRNLAKERAIRNETLMRALEIIAVGDSKDPVADAKDALVEAGCWGKEQTT